MGPAAAGALSAAVSGIIGLGQGAINNNQNKKAQQRAYNMQRALNQQGAELGLQMWKDTNYLPQVRELKKAGLSTGLMYEGGGAGGTTSAGSGGGAPQQAPTDYNIGGMALQGAQTMANVKLTEAQAKLANTQADKLAGADTHNTVADTELKQMQTKNQQIVNDIGSQTIEHAVMQIKANADKAQSEARSALVQANVDENTQKSKEKQITQDALNSVLQAGAIKAGTRLTEEQTRSISVELAQGWEELYQKARANDNQKGMVNIAGFRAKLDEILGKANLNLKEKELMIRGAEAFFNTAKGNPKGKTTETHREDGSWETRNETYH